MSTAKRRRGKSLHLELPNGATDERPPISALFLVQFDVKAGYTIAWRRCVPGLELAESVEFKSLPSGLHNVQEDLVYFMHDDNYVGISAFVNRSGAELARNALMLAVGALVPLEHGRLGKCWKHAEKLKELAGELVVDPTKIQSLEDFWHTNQVSPLALSVSSTSRSPSAHNGVSPRRQGQVSPHSRPGRRNRAISTASALAPLGQGLSPYHPALSLPSFVDTFGPLVYPLYKAALLRKRILLVTQAPVQLSCNFVYDISILSNIPSSVSELLPLDPLPMRLQPLFSIGIHDIDSLSRKIRPNPTLKDEPDDEDPGYGWVACTTDDVLGSKTSLYEILVTIPPTYTKQAKEKVWPKLRNSQGVELKASQRDLRRYRTLRQGLQTANSRSRAASPYVTIRNDDRSEEQAPLFPIENTQETFDDASSTSDEKLVEPLSWSELAYSSFMWWASAGEKREGLDSEVENDTALLRDMNGYANDTPGRPSSRRRSSQSPNPIGPMLTDGVFAAPEMAMIAYFHRLTTQVLGTLAELVDTPDADVDNEQEQIEDNDKDDVIHIEGDDMARMGLDAWSEGDKRFVVELMDFYWGRKAEVRGGKVECCGVRIC